jgi:hypothetical protein
VTQLFEQRERRIHRARARRVAATEFLLELLDELVAVARLLVDEAEQHQAQIAGAEHAPATAAATPERTATEGSAAKAETAFAQCLVAAAFAAATSMTPHREPLGVVVMPEKSSAKHDQSPCVPIRYGDNDISLVLLFQEHLT